MLDEDRDAWHPLLPSDLAAMPAWQCIATRLLAATPLKLLASIGAWASSWSGFDLKAYQPQQREPMLRSWATPFVFMGVVWPVMLAIGAWRQGWQGW